MRSRLARRGKQTGWYSETRRSHRLLYGAEREHVSLARLESRTLCKMVFLVSRYPSDLLRPRSQHETAGSLRHVAMEVVLWVIAGR